MRLPIRHSSGIDCGGPLANARGSAGRSLVYCGEQRACYSEWGRRSYLAVCRAQPAEKTDHGKRWSVPLRLADACGPIGPHGGTRLTEPRLLRSGCTNRYGLLIFLVIWAAAASYALASSPVEFGMAELNAAIASRDLAIKPRIVAELNTDPPETYRIEPYAGGCHITGGDLRGLMYGLLEAAEQIRTDGKLKAARGVPALALRGVRIDAESLAHWFDSGEFAQHYFAEMARDRFNRLEVTFESSPSGPRPEAFQFVRHIAQSAAEYGVDIAIGFDAANVSAIEDSLATCTSVHAVVLHTETIPDPSALLKILSGAGRRVVLEIPESPNAASLIDAAGEQGTPVRVFSAFSGTASNPSPRDLYWVLDQAQGSDAVKAISGAGFEIASPVVERKPAIESIADWGRFGYSRPLH